MKMKILISLIILIATLVSITTTASAFKLTDIPIMPIFATIVLPVWFWICILPGVVMGVIVLFKDKKKAPWLAPVAVVCIIIGAAGWYFVPNPQFVAAEEQVVSTGVTWEVSASTSDGALVTVNNNSKTFNMMVFANTTANTLRKKDNSTAFADPSIYFKCRPSKVGAATGEDTTLAYTNILSLTDPGKVCDSGASYLFSRATGTGEVTANLPWTADGITKYESNTITVNYGTSEYANITLNFNDAGIANANALDGQSYTFYIDVCGITWTARLSIVDAYA